MPARTACLLPLCLGFTAALTAAALARAPEQPAAAAGVQIVPVQLAPPVRATLCSAVTPLPQHAGAVAPSVVFRDRPSQGGGGGARAPQPPFAAIGCGGPGAIQRT